MVEFDRSAAAEEVHSVRPAGTYSGSAPDYYSGVGKDAYTKALESEKGIYNPTGIMPPNGPQTALNVLSAFNADVKGKNIDLSKTYTDQFVKAAQQGRRSGRGHPAAAGFRIRRCRQHPGSIRGQLGGTRGCDVGLEADRLARRAVRPWF